MQTLKPILVVTHRPDLSVVLKEALPMPQMTRRVIMRPRADMVSGYGPPLWAALHSRYFNWTGGEDQQWLNNFARSVPCGDCSRHWNQGMQVTPPDWANMFQWSVDRHNGVNRYLGKPELSLEQAAARWACGQTIQT